MQMLLWCTTRSAQLIITATADKWQIAAPARDSETAAGAHASQRQFDFHRHLVGLQICPSARYKKVRAPIIVLRRRPKPGTCA